jgi:hypothetical protein
MASTPDCSIGPWGGRWDLNPQRLVPQTSALPDCATTTIEGTTTHFPRRQVLRAEVRQFRFAVGLPNVWLRFKADPATAVPALPRGFEPPTPASVVLCSIRTELREYVEGRFPLAGSPSIRSHSPAGTDAPYGTGGLQPPSARHLSADWSPGLGSQQRALSRIRTCDLYLRRVALYPTEL